MKKLFPLVFIIPVLFAFGLNSCSSADKKEETKKAEEAPPAPVPGTANVEAEVLSVKKEGDKVKCTLIIKNVLGYGSATPPLPTDTEKEVFVSRYLISQNKEVKEGNTYKMVLRYEEAMGEEGNSYWQISSFK